MARAYVLITVAVGRVKQVVRELRRVKGVVSATPVTGPYDVVVLVEAADYGGITGVVVDKVHRIKGIVDTTTAMVGEF